MPKNKKVDMTPERVAQVKANIERYRESLKRPVCKHTWEAAFGMEPCFTTGLAHWYPGDVRATRRFLKEAEDMIGAKS